MRQRGLVGTTLALALTLVLGGCPDGSSPDADFPDGAPTGAVCPAGSPLTYDSFGEPFFDAYCQSCHASTVTGGARNGAPATVTFDDAEMIRARSFDIERAAAAGPNSINTAMPYDDPKPSLDDRYRLGEWLACGAP